eukprot:12584160-Ditylum_brightwellii.AAC.1
MGLSKFKQIRSAMHPEGTQVSNNGDKYHQLRHFIHMFDRIAREILCLGPNASFDKGGVSMHSRFCPDWQYNKDKPDKLRVDFFILADVENYFIHHLDYYQEKKRQILILIPL